MEEKRRIWIAFVLCSLFFVLELGGGIWSNSLALLSDSFHMFTDVISMVIAGSALHLSTRKPTNKLHFGYGRVEVLGALLSILLIHACTIWLCWEAVDRFSHPEAIDGLVMFGVALVGVIFNLVLIFSLHHGHDHSHGGHGGHTQLISPPDAGSLPDIERPLRSHSPGDALHDHSSHSHDDHSHSHGHSHGKSVNMRAAILHVIGDLLSSIGVLIASIFIMADQQYTKDSKSVSRFVIVDPICTFIFSLIVLVTTVPLLKECLGVLMEANIHFDRSSAIDELEHELGVRILDLRSWLISNNFPYAVVVVQTSSATSRVSTVPKNSPHFESQPALNQFEPSRFNLAYNQTTPNMAAANAPNEELWLNRLDTNHHGQSPSLTADVKNILEKHGIPPENCYVVIQ